MERFGTRRFHVRRTPKVVRVGVARVWIATAVVASLILVSASESSASTVPPAAKKNSNSTAVIPAHPLGPSLHLARVSGRTFDIRTDVHVLWWTGHRYHVAIGIARHAIDNGVQTPQSMCRSTSGCVAATNADFFAVGAPGTFDPGDSVGGIVRNCVLLHTPEISHQQVDLTTGAVSQGLEWSTTLDINGSSVPVTAINQMLPLSYSQVQLPLSGTLVYTPAYGQRTPSAAGRITYVFKDVRGTTTPTRINSTAQLMLVARSLRSLKVKPGHVDISVPISSTLSVLAHGDVVTMSTASTAGCNNIGGHPILLDQGVAIPIDPADTALVRPYARTALGWTSTGATVIVTVDGRDGVSGATAYQLTALLESLHVITAIALDGGYSTSLYARGKTMNKPASGQERPVATALLVLRG